MRNLLFILVTLWSLSSCNKNAEAQAKVQREVDSIGSYGEFRQKMYKLQIIGSPITEEKIDSIWNYNHKPIEK